MDFKLPGGVLSSDLFEIVSEIPDRHNVPRRERSLHRSIRSSIYFSLDSYNFRFRHTFISSKIIPKTLL